jgi:hypothetical protein
MTLKGASVLDPRVALFEIDWRWVAVKEKSATRNEVSKEPIILFCKRVKEKFPLAPATWWDEAMKVVEGVGSELSNAGFVANCLSAHEDILVRELIPDEDKETASSCHAKLMQTYENIRRS